MPAIHSVYRQSYFIQTKRYVSLTFMISLLAVGGCGARVGGLCEEAADCGIIEADDESECRSDLRRALADGDLKKHHVDNCLGCMRDNECGIDIAVDCANVCSEVAPYVFGSRVN